MPSREWRDFDSDNLPGMEEPMAFCQSCGASLAVDQLSCPSCGSAGKATPASAPMASNVAALLTYVPCIITAIIFLVIEPYKNDRFVRFHAFQSIFFGVAWIAFWVIWDVLAMVLTPLTAGFFALISLPVTLLLSLGGLAFWCFLLYKAYNNQVYKVPFIGAIAEKHANQ
jgi:uncharacterized membrane protein